MDGALFLSPSSLLLSLLLQHSGIDRLELCSVSPLVSSSVCAVSSARLRSLRFVAKGVFLSRTSGLVAVKVVAEYKF